MREHVGASILINLSIIVVVVYQQVNEYTNSSLTVINLAIVVQYDAQYVYTTTTASATKTTTASATKTTTSVFFSFSIKKKSSYTCILVVVK